jgi:four helix bundle protein
MPKSLHDLVAFQRAIDLTQAIYEVSKVFPADERYGLTSQIRRAAVSVVSQIAEGHGRITYGEWRQMLSQARGSLFEVEAQTIVAQRLRILGEDEFSVVARHVAKTGKALAGLIRWVQNMEKTARPRDRETPRPR